MGIDLFQTLAIAVIFALIVFMNKAIQTNAKSITRLSGTITKWFNRH